MVKNSQLSKKNYPTDKDKYYLSNYESYFSHLKNEEISLLEIGVFKGGSLQMWRDYFERGTIVGLDLNDLEIKDESGRIHFYKGFQQNTELLNKIASDRAPGGFDIIIDDGSHFGELTAISFWHLFENHLKPGGIYVIEDWRTGYWGAWPDGKQYNLKKGIKFKRGWVKNHIDKKLSDYLNEKNRNGLIFKLKNSIAFRLRNLLMNRRMKNHDYGMVGFVKQLVDEMGMDAITNPYRGSKVEQRDSLFTELNIKKGQIFVVKK